METSFEDSILRTIKRMLGIPDSVEQFDLELIVNINTALSVLTQLGIGPDKGFSITGKDETWSEFGVSTLYDAVKTYVFMKVKMMFDPPQSSVLADVYNRQISELEWRLNFQAETDIEEGE